ncbi:hypothetical protein Plhal304r1_c025g0084981 [Plasmopara halstedii]
MYAALVIVHAPIALYWDKTFTTRSAITIPLNDQENQGAPLKCWRLISH